MDTFIVRAVRSALGRTTIATTIAATLALGALAACGSDDAPTATLSAPSDGSAVAGPVELVMAADGITIEKADQVRDGAGHFHVIADGECVATGEPIARDADHVHFGGGQSEGVIYLEPGRHELCLQVGDGAHTALDVTDRVTVDVGIVDRAQWCAVVGDVDDMFEAADNSSAEFAARQVAYENIRRLLSQLSAGIEVVDADVREDIGASLAFAANLATAVTTAPDEHAAGRAVDAIFREGVDLAAGLPGAAWIREQCGVDIDA